MDKAINHYLQEFKGSNGQLFAKFYSDEIMSLCGNGELLQNTNLTKGYKSVFDGFPNPELQKQLLEKIQRVYRLIMDSPIQDDTMESFKEITEQQT